MNQKKCFWVCCARAPRANTRANKTRVLLVGSWRSSRVCWRDANLRRLSASDRSVGEGGVLTAPLIVIGAARGTGAFGRRARAGPGRDARWARAMRDRGQKYNFTKTPQKTVSCRQNGAASVAWNAAFSELWAKIQSATCPPPLQT